MQENEMQRSTDYDLRKGLLDGMLTCRLLCFNATLLWIAKSLIFQSILTLILLSRGIREAGVFLTFFKSYYSADRVQMKMVVNISQMNSISKTLSSETYIFIFVILVSVEFSRSRIIGSYWNK